MLYKDIIYTIITIAVAKQKSIWGMMKFQIAKADIITPHFGGEESEALKLWDIFRCFMMNKWES